MRILILNKELEIFRIINFINSFKKFQISEKKIKILLIHPLLTICLNGKKRLI